MKRTNLVLDEELLEEATRLSGAKTYSAAVTRALEELVRRYKASRILELRGSGIWESASSPPLLPRRAKYSFGALKRARARGDCEGLTQRDRRLLRVDVEGRRGGSCEKLRSFAGGGLGQPR